MMKCTGCLAYQNQCFHDEFRKKFKLSSDREKKTNFILFTFFEYAYIGYFALIIDLCII